MFCLLPYHRYGGSHFLVDNKNNHKNNKQKKKQILKHQNLCKVLSRKYCLSTSPIFSTILGTSFLLSLRLHILFALLFSLGFNFISLFEDKIMFLFKYITKFPIIHSNRRGMTRKHTDQVRQYGIYKPIQYISDINLSSFFLNEI